MASGFIDAAMSPAISNFRGLVGTIAANMSMTAPTQEISGRPVPLTGVPPKWNKTAKANAVKIR
jgi:hypothetical protein